MLVCYICYTYMECVLSLSIWVFPLSFEQFSVTKLPGEQRFDSNEFMFPNVSWRISGSDVNALK